MLTSKTKTAQKVSLELLKTFADICNKYGIRYYVTGGTLLGAIRHKGFIPWDDDVDIDMPRKDFQHFLKISDEVKEQRRDEILKTVRKSNMRKLSLTNLILNLEQIKD